MRALFELRTVFYLDSVGYKLMGMIKIGKFKRDFYWLLKKIKQVEVEDIPNDTPKMEDPFMLCENPDDFKNRKVLEPEDM